ncbi:sensor histidine kinase [Herbiconiux sp. VKM Ac-1786]|uniref:sensor histidine kinase n=1 Tax=Herbiconiux sp. VKM Ac-1786 TaxID=2783824 RepID=UPI00188A2445|nr:sensor histidine kinase [Herbiconiux sp. VKM Ac-1786]MBF4572884.1 sensor histidine kinase [Herbiconiux sp. VKM Ac-1786]
MTLQIAADVDGRSTSRALATAGTWLAGVFLAATALIAMTFIPVTGRGDIVLGIAGLAVTGVAVVAALRTASHLRAVLYTIAAGLTLGLYAFVVTGVSVAAASPGAAPASDYVLLSMPEFAILVVGIAARSLGRSLVLGTLALVVGPGLVQLAAWQQGMRLALDVPVVASWIALSLFVVSLWVGRREAARGTAQMLDSALAEERDLANARFSARAADWVADTVLADLRALAAAAPGPLEDRTLQSLDRDLANLADTSLVLSGPEIGASASRSLASVPLLVSVVRAAEQQGLRIRVTGDTEVINGVRPSDARNLERAIAECLDNVRRHSGQDEAEIAVYFSPPEVSVMVSDAGVGFDVDAAGDETVGLRVGVIDSIVEAGGSVQIWSRPGTGTAVFMTVPGAPA